MSIRSIVTALAGESKMTYQIKVLKNDNETTVLEFFSVNGNDAALMARNIRNETGLETRVYDAHGLRGIMDARI